MTYKTGAAARSRLDPTSSEAGNVDRILLAACAVIWLAALGSAVAATVALVDLGNGHQESSATDSGTPWLLYGVIGVSALVILGAIPLLIRARRSSDRRSPGRPRRQPPDPLRSGPGDHTRPRAPHAAAADSRRRPPQPAGNAVRYPTASGSARSTPHYRPAVDRVWLRCAVVIASAIGLALLGIGIATYLMAAGHDTFAWVGLSSWRPRHAGACPPYRCSISASCTSSSTADTPLE